MGIPWPALGDAVLALAPLAILYGWLPCWAAGVRRSSDPAHILAAIVGSMCLQAVLGWCWNLWRIGPPMLEISAYAAVLLAAGWIARRRGWIPAPTGVTLDAPLALICLAGAALRLVHPLLTPALGQSDAYSHLQFIGDILERGHIRNPAYPPGYHWVMMVPAALGVEAHVVARFGGAWCGLLMPLAFHVLLRDRAGRIPALLAAWAVACCPVFMLLIKTGVGVYPNQFGLLLVPCALHAYLRWVEAPGAARAGCGLVPLFGLAISAPMMLADLGLVVVAERAWWLVAGGRRGRRWLWALGLIGILLALLVAWQVGRTGYDRLAATVTALTGRGLAAESAVPALAALGVLLRDFLSIKRWGLGLTALDAAAAASAVLFALLLGKGWRDRRADLVAAASWGLLALGQTVLGVLQFSRYQRAGWQLLEAAAWTGALLAAWWLGRLLITRSGLRRAVVLVVLVMTVVSFAQYPRHRVFHSRSEAALVGLFRAVERCYARDQGVRPPWSFTPAELPAGMDLYPKNALTVLIRPFTGFTRGQGDPTHALLRRRPGIAIAAIGDGRAPVRLEWPRQYLLLVDEPSVKTAAELGAAARLQDDLAREFVQVQDRARRAREDAAAILAGVDAARWRTVPLHLAPGLDAWFLQPLPAP